MKPERNITVAVVIATFNREKVLIDTVESVLKLDPQPEEIFIIDQTPQHEHETEEYLRKISEAGVRVIRLPEPSVCFARNLGAALARSDIIVYLDDDVIINDKKFIDRNRKNYADPKIDAVQGQILLPGSKQTSSDLTTYKPMFPFPSWEENGRPFVTANVSIRRSVLLKIGGFDEGFSGRTYANEDGDLGLRMLNRGYTIDFDPSACLLHLQTPYGGNRITGRDAFPEWTRSVTFFQFALRHSAGWLRLGRILTVFRLIAFRKENVQELWHLPKALLHALYALGVAMQRHKVGFRSSLFNPGVHYLNKQFLDVSTR